MPKHAEIDDRTKDLNDDSTVGLVEVPLTRRRIFSRMHTKLEVRLVRRTSKNLASELYTEK